MLLRLDRAEYSPLPQRLKTDIALLRQEVEQMDVSAPGARAAILERLEALAVSVEETPPPAREPVETR